MSLLFLPIKTTLLKFEHVKILNVKNLNFTFEFILPYRNTNDVLERELKKLDMCIASENNY